ncbi:MAG: zinc ribbon domain-containing protein [Clostridiales bacterium]|nr:zinc ribbon domain-containing protein [Clostridiales bacterium]
MFSGFLKCPGCGRAVARSEVKGNAYYRCTTYAGRSKKGTFGGNHYKYSTRTESQEARLNSDIPAKEKSFQSPAV